MAGWGVCVGGGRWPAGVGRRCGAVALLVADLNQRRGARVGTVLVDDDCLKREPSSRVGREDDITRAERAHEN